MLLSADSTLAFPRPLVFSTYRDHLVDLVEFLPNIRAIEVESKKEVDGKVEFKPKGGRTTVNVVS